ncbi:MAG: hypothetical protein IT460_01425 [Planctomycetes bacterium]|nr:hypothetical protein [Planctomycetota bacterium]
MRVHRPHLVPSPTDATRVRLVVEVDHERPRPATESLWIEVPVVDGAPPDLDGTPWLAALLPLAAVTGEPLRLDAPVDRRTLLGAREVLEVWRTWYGTTHVVPVEAPETTTPPAPRRTAAFFSGGVDSTFTAIGRADRTGEVARGPVHTLLFLEGFDLRLPSTEAIARARRDVEATAAVLGLPLVRVATNLRSTRWDDASWPLLAHGPLLAAVALALGRRHDRVLVPGSVFAGALVPWASHPLTDLWWSSSAVAVHPDGVATDRFDKVAAIARRPDVLARLRVCYRSPEGANCGTCAKCLTTMAMLAACDALDAAPSFPERAAFLDRLRATRARFPSERRHLGRALAAARATGKDVLADAIAEVLSTPEGATDLTLPRRRRAWWRPRGRSR